MSKNTFEQQVITYQAGPVMVSPTGIALGPIGDNVLTFNFPPQDLATLKQITMVVGGATGTGLTSLQFALGVNNVYDLFNVINLTATGADTDAYVTATQIGVNYWVLVGYNATGTATSSKLYSGPVDSLRLTSNVNWTGGIVNVFYEKFII